MELLLSCNAAWDAWWILGELAVANWCAPAEDWTESKWPGLAWMFCVLWPADSARSAGLLLVWCWPLGLWSTVGYSIEGISLVARL